MIKEIGAGIGGILAALAVFMLAIYSSVTVDSGIEASNNSRLTPVTTVFSGANRGAHLSTATEVFAGLSIALLVVSIAIVAGFIASRLAGSKLKEGLIP